MLNSENGFSAADLAAVVGNNNDGFGSGNGMGWWILILLLFANNGWGGNGWGGNGDRGCVTPMIPQYMANVATNESVQNGFNQAALVSGLGDIGNTLSNGFANAEISRTNSLMNLTNQMNGIAMAQQGDFCATREGIADLKYTVATEACNDRQAVNNGVRDIMASNVANTQALLNTINGGIQAIQDKLCQQEIESLKTQNQNLQTQLNLANLRGSQDAQTAAILAGQSAQTAILEDYLNPVPRPAYVVQNPNCCGNVGYNGCGCGN